MREQQREFTRRLLMDAGRRQFEHKGYGATKVEDITVAAGTSRATFYLHFRTKLELFTAIWAAVDPDWIGRYRELDQYLSTTSRPSRERLREWLAAALEFWTANAPLLRVLRQARSLEPGLQHKARLESSNEFVSCMTRWLERNGGNRDESRQRAIMLELMTGHLFQELSIGEIPLDRNIALDLLTDLWWTVFRPARIAPTSELRG